MKKWFALGMLTLGLFSAAKAVGQPVLPALTFYSMGTPQAVEATLEATRQFEEDTQAARFQLVFAENELAYEKKLAEGLSQGTADVVELTPEMLRTLGTDDQGAFAFLDLEPLQDILDLKPFSYLGLESGTVQGRLCALPTSMTAHVFAWNETALKARKLKIPDSTQDLLTAAEALPMEEKTYLLAADAPGRIALLVTYVQSRYGKKWIDPKTGQCELSLQQVMDGIAYLQWLEKARVLVPWAEQGELLAGWRTGRYLGCWVWETSSAELKAALPEGDRMALTAHLNDWGPYEGGFQKATTLFAISASSLSPGECALLLQYLLNEAKGARTLGGLRGIPDSTEAHAACREFGRLDKTAIAMNKIAKSWGELPMPLGFEAPIMLGQDGFYHQVLNGLSTGILTPETAAKALISGAITAAK